MLYIIFVSLVLIIKVQENETKILRTKNVAVQRIDNFKDKRNREQLAKVVEYLNGEHQLMDEQGERDDQVEISKRYEIEDLMKLLQKNYNARTDQRNKVPSVRIHIINNPAVLKKYLQNLRKKQSTSSESDITSSSDTTFDRVFGRDHFRRNSKFRAQTGKNIKNNDDSNIKVYSQSNIDVRLSGMTQKSQEDAEISFKSHDYKISDSDKGKEDVGFKQKTKKRAKYNDNIDDIGDIDAENNKGNNNKKKHKRDWGEYDKNDDIAKSTAWIEDERKTKKLKDKKRNNSWPEREGDDWNEPNKERNNWDEPKSKKKEVNFVESHLKKEKNNWNNNKWSKTTRNEWIETDRTTKKSWNRNIKEKNTFKRPSFIASIPEYKHFGRERGESRFRGRTPIPFVGKKGIYDDN